ncbi:hypothetical protein [Nocardiopsis dassonvillei]|uniref:Uncharacterized protein n=1 Tax=Nocardiopsis dassonvillei (strain ATCC 23218 / DSM 43111 / CIP 107115 / JCM 7437 / KCTC 9190 / NBRC 14626 / NCTC 10488 / NRRL B-5397 / IMRU 509) TaxID=446468 RepID=D7B2N2_NOCDD|nr:hypothetical protein [Nocardiopsis dassonvillei]ADH66730.1 conserved hypothetical protein [Nocardiopsis dassonvillei subsp. dassonvillei DSM 43111]APC35015.1 hypothetical protein A9R04_10110 [Nocardiopsis dassonvillei]NKY80816.1 hypothetical protein [Nocardiopsis dassonvillei]VEI92753.1 Uncharacterised protein [Nocardiopsis dassonvillei]
MKLTRIAGECNNRRTCPTVYASDRGTVVVQGYTLAAGDLTQITLPEGESAVEIPLSLLKEAARVHGD